MKTKFNLTSVFGLIVVVLSLGLTACASNPNVKKFEFQVYSAFDKRKMGTGNLYIKDDGSSASVWYEFGSGMNKCDNTESTADKTETDTDFVYTTSPKLAGCEHRRFVLSKNNAKLVVQKLQNGGWVTIFKPTRID